MLRLHTPLRHLVPCLLVLFLAACNPSRTEINMTAPSSQSRAPKMLEEMYRRNPAPRQRYDITMTIADAPGPFGMVQGSAFYEASDCSYVIDRFAGVRGRPNHGMDIDFKKRDDTTYIGTVYLDAMLDEDYFGEGACHWQMISIGVGLKATGAHAETRFSASMMREEIVLQRPVATFFWKERYPNSRIDDFPSFGEADIENFIPEIRDNLFSITLTPKEVQP